MIGRLVIVLATFLTRASPCEEAIQSALGNTLNVFTHKADIGDDVRRWRYSGKGINELGHYDACVRSEENEYFLLDIKVVGMKTFFGLCLPSNCSESDVKNAISTVDTTGKVNVIPIEHFSMGFGGYLLIVILCFILVLGIFASFYDSEAKQQGIHAVISCFSLKDNYKGLFSIRKSKPGDHSNILDGVRVICMVHIMTGHVFTFQTHNAMVNLEEFSPKIFPSWWGYFVISGEFSVDTFFWMGGFLLGFLLLSEVEKKRGKFGILGWSLVYIHRFLRILPVYLFMLYFYMSIYPSASSGPMWLNHGIVTKDCEEYWWTIPLFLNNFIPHGYGNQCLGVGWYLANDIQFFAVGPLLILMYYFSARWVSWTIKVLLYIIGYIISYSIAKEYDFRVNLSNPKNLVGDWKDFYHIYYTKPYTRFFPYLAGLFCGFIFLRYSKKFITKETDTHTDYICNKFIWLWRHPIISWVSFLFGLFVLRFVVTLQNPLYDDIFNDDVWDKNSHFLILPLTNIMYSYGLCMVLMPMIMGKISIVTSFLTSEFFSPLAKLTFSCFLVQFGVILAYFSSQNAQIVMTGLNVFRGGVAFSFLSYLLSFPVYMLIEAPFTNLEKLACSMLRGGR